MCKLIYMSIKCMEDGKLVAAMDNGGSGDAGGGECGLVMSHFHYLIHKIHYFLL